MDIYAKPGTKVRFINANGLREDRDKARSYLTENEVYTVNRIAIGPWRSEVFLEEVLGQGFNTVMFEEVVVAPAVPPGAVAIFTDPNGLVVATSVAFGGPAEDLGMKARRGLAMEVISAYCAPAIVPAISGRMADQIMESLTMKGGFRVTIKPISGAGAKQ